MEINVALVYLKIDVSDNKKNLGINNISCPAFRRFGLNLILSSDNSELFRVTVSLHKEKKEL